MGCACADQSRRERLLEALQADAELRRVAHGEGALALALGDTLHELFVPGRLLKLHCAREKDYMVERLGLPARTGYQFLKLSRATRGKELLRRAVLCGAITPNKALAIAKVCVGEYESAWVDLAMHSGLAEVVKRVEAFSGERIEEEKAGARLLIEMTTEERDRYEKAVELCRELLGPGTPRWVAQESIAWEWLGGHGGLSLAEAAPPEEEKARREPVAEGIAAWGRTREEVEKELRSLSEAAQVVTEGPDPFCVTPEALDAGARRLARTRERLTEPLGWMLAAFREAGYWSELGCETFEEYGRERLGMAARTVRERIWLARRRARLPELRASVRSGELSCAKALSLARVAGRGTRRAGWRRRWFSRRRRWRGTPSPRRSGGIVHWG